MSEPLSAADAGALQARLAEVYGVRPDSVLVVRGIWHGLALALRLARDRGATRFNAPALPETERLAQIISLDRVDAGASGVTFLSSPRREDGAVLTIDDIERARGGLLVIDETGIEIAEGPSLAPRAAATPDLIVLRNVSAAFGGTGDPCAAAIAAPALINELALRMEPEALAASTLLQARAATAPGAMILAAARQTALRDEKRRMAGALSAAPGALNVAIAEAATLFITPRERAAAEEAIRRFSVPGEWTSDGRFALRIGAPEENDRALAAFGAFAEPARRRRAEVRRETRETRIAAAVDLDQADGSVIATGVGFFDHMLAQVAAHGGFSLTLACEGDLDIDPHHTIEDCALVFGEALRGALGDRRGISRFGFSAPMDEADAEVLIDLSGRPYLKFEGAFRAAMIGGYPTEMTEHVFRSIATSLGAAIHVRIRGENDHHKTEVAFKAFGRALRAAIRIEGDTLPSTKGRL